MLPVRESVAVPDLPHHDPALRPRLEQPVTALPGDLIARLHWIGEHDRARLVALLRTVDRDTLRIALGPAGPDSAAPTKPGPAHDPRQG